MKIQREREKDILIIKQRLADSFIFTIGMFHSWFEPRNNRTSATYPSQWPLSSSCLFNTITLVIITIIIVCVVVCLPSSNFSNFSNQSFRKDNWSSSKSRIRRREKIRIRFHRSRCFSLRKAIHSVWLCSFEDLLIVFKFFFVLIFWLFCSQSNDRDLLDLNHESA